MSATIPNAQELTDSRLVAWSCIEWSAPVKSKEFALVWPNAFAERNAETARVPQTGAKHRRVEDELNGTLYNKFVTKNVELRKDLS